MMVRLAVRGDYAMVAKEAMMAMMLMMRSWRSWRSWQDDDGEDKIAVIEMKYLIRFSRFVRQQALTAQALKCQCVANFIH